MTWRGCVKFDDFNLYVSDWVLQKIKMKEIDLTEIEEAFYNCNGVYIEETREEHKTKPPTYWFIAPTSDGRLLKVCFIPRYDLKFLTLKTAFDAEEKEINAYEDYF